jgi:hypothetical protein
MGFLGENIRGDAASLVYLGSQGATYAGRENASWDFDTLRGTTDVYGNRPKGGGPRSAKDIESVIVQTAGGGAVMKFHDPDTGSPLDWTFEARTRSHGPRLIFNTDKQPGGADLVVFTLRAGI